MALIHRNIQPQARSMRELVGMVNDGSLDLNAPYQRGDVWRMEQRINLIRSFLLGVPVAAIVLNRRGGNIAWRANHGDPDEVWYSCIDGKQRLTTMVMWWSADVAIPSEWIEPKWIEPDRRTDEHITITGLTTPGQRMTASRFLVPVAEAQLDSLTEEAEVYGLINSAGTAHTAADLERAWRVQQ